VDPGAIRMLELTIDPRDPNRESILEEMHMLARPSRGMGFPCDCNMWYCAECINDDGDGPFGVTCMCGNCTDCESRRR
jgi:hypothetical protein